jgi:hypothetical protein
MHSDILNKIHEFLLSKLSATEDSQEVKDFLREHSAIIRKKPFVKEIAGDLSLYFLLRYGLINDERIKSIIEAQNIDAPNILTKAYCLAFGMSGTKCENNNYKFLAKMIRRGLVFCDRNCACSLASKSDKNISKSDEEKEAIKKKIIATNMERFGVPVSTKAASVKAKVAATNMARYGYTTPLANADKRKNGMIAKYGASHPSQVPQFRDKIKNSMLERHGAIIPLQVQKFKDKAVATNLSRYGTEWGLGSQEIREKIASTNIDRYGGVSPMSSEIIRKAMYNTNFEKYGVLYSSQKNFSDDTKLFLSYDDIFRRFASGKPVTQIARELSVDKKTVVNYAVKYDVSFDIKGSSYEQDIANFLKENDIKFSERNRKLIHPLELDFFIEDLNIAIEFNGIYYHSDIFLDKKYHETKMLACEKVGIRLIHIFEDEWLFHNAAVKGRILNLCKKSQRGVGARKLEIRTIDKPLAQSFTEANHIQGKSFNSFYEVGAFYEDTLVAVMTFSYQRGTQHVELSRFCSDGKTYPGAFSRMFKFAIKDKGFDYVVSYADLRYSTGDLYYKTGFQFAGNVPVDYRYVKGNKTFHKQHLAKNNIAKRGIDIKGKTESQLAKELGFNKIYDCGKKKFVWKLHL